jgi:predicted O-linked N-acetylglucosamine transferase (SPINDLY family)
MNKKLSDSIRTQSTLRDAISLHQSGALNQAEMLYRVILESQPDHPDALHLLGLVNHQRGSSDIAANLILQAIESNGQESLYYKNYALVVSALGKYEVAISSWQKFIAISPLDVDAHVRLGNCFKKIGRLELALDSYARAIRLNPDYADCHYLMANTQVEIGNFEGAVERYNFAIELKPDFPAAYNNRGNALRELGRIDEAISSFRRAIELQPEYCAAYGNLGVAFLDKRSLDDALVCFDKAIQIDPLGVDFYNNRATALYELDRIEAAIDDFRRAIEIEPGHLSAYRNLANALLQIGRLEEALVCFSAVIRINPQADFVVGIIRHIKMRICDWTNFESDREALELKILNSERAVMPWISIGLTESPRLQFLAAKLYSPERLSDELPFDGGALKQRLQAPPGSGSRVKIGYYSADFHDHATSHLIADTLEYHDKNLFEILLFSFGPILEDGMQTRLATTVDQFFDVRQKSDSEIAAFSRDLAVDVAVDLKGYTQHSRPGIFAARCAPIQVGFLGYPGTMGAKFIDYIFADRVLIPDGLASFYSEKVVRLPGSYQPNDSRRTISNRQFSRLEFGLPEGGFVFCCFNNNYKILPETFDLWMRIILKVEGSVLWLLGDNPSAIRNLYNEAESRGVSKSRIVFAERAPHDIHLARHRLADLYLDTFPCNAHTSASDSLWAGLPLITRVGETFASRVAASLLSVLGLQELIAETKDDYFSLAITFATDVSRLNAIRERLEANKRRSPLFNARLFARNLEAAYRAMNSMYLTGRSPSHFDVLENGSVRYW